MRNFLETASRAKLKQPFSIGKVLSIYDNGNVPEAGICIFCNKPDGNREHIVAEWMLRDLGLYQQKFKIGFGQQKSDGEMDEIMAPQRLSSFITNRVCEDCNTGWMSGLERTVKPLLTPLLQEHWPPDDRRTFESLFVHSAVITRWLLKSACTFGMKMSVPVPQDMREALFHKCLHPEVSADLSFNEQCGLYIGMSREWNVYKDDNLSVMKCGDQSFRFVWQIHHLAMRVSYFPGCEKNIRKPRFPVRLYPKFGISPDYAEGGTSKRSYHYGTLEQLEHETTYFYGGNRHPPPSAQGFCERQPQSVLRA